MTETSSISQRLAGLKAELVADVAAVQPPQAVREAAQSLRGAADAELAAVQALVRTHPLAAVGGSFLIGALAGLLLGARPRR